MNIATPEASVVDRVQGLVKTPREVAIITTMMNDRSGIWDITEERTALLSRDKRRLSLTHRAAIDEMMAAAQRGDRFWETRAEYQAALLNLSLLYQKPTDRAIEEVLVAVRVGAAHDGVSDKPWVKDALALFEKLLAHDPGRPNALGGLDDDAFEDSAFYVPEL